MRLVPVLCSVAVALAALVGTATRSPTEAQTLGAPSSSVGNVVEGDIVEGRISRADQRTRTITLDNGQEYLVLPPLTPNWDLLREGAAVKMRYSVDAGRNLATHVEVRP
jgi:Protein of unknown function (DUF1344)